MQLTASEERRKRKAFANIERTSEYKNKYAYGRTWKGRIYASDFLQDITGIIDNSGKLVVEYNYKKHSNISLMHCPVK